MTGQGSDESRMPPPPPPIEHQDVDARGWWLSLLVGVALVALGAWMLTNLFESVVILAMLVGVSLIVGGIVEVAALGGRHALGWLAWLCGASLVVAGVTVLAWPDITLWALAVLAGLGLLAGGVLRVAVGLANRDHPDWAGDVVVGGCGVALGAAVLAWPDATIIVLALLLGIRAIGTGLVAIGIGWQVHRMATAQAR